MADSRGVLTIRLNEQLGSLVASVKVGIQNNLSLFNIVAETTLAELLNRIHGWALVNANSIRQNYPGVDLIDPQQQIAVQVTSTCTLDKVRNTLEKTGKLADRFEKLIILVITHEQPTKAMKNYALPENVKHMDIWNISDVLRDALVLSVEKLKEITDFLDGEMGSVTENVAHLQHLKLPPRSVLQSGGFVGREAELEAIRRRFDGGADEVYLTGLGGMGKTELAIHYGLHHRGTVYFARFDTSFTRTLAKMAQHIQPPLPEEELRKPEKELADTVLKLLEESSSADLLILDNVDGEQQTLAELQADPAFKSIRSLRLRRLMTTRSEAPRAISVKAMEAEPLFEIFHNHGAELTEAEMRELIQAVNNHTLTVDLIARTLNGKGWRKVTAENMLTALRGNLKDQKYRKIATDYNQSTAQAQIYQHLSVVFDLSGMSSGSKTVMACATLLPEGGMEGECFGLSLREEEQDALDTLLERGWLEMKGGLLTIHPVIRLVCRTELAPTDEDCGEFLDRLWEQYDEKQYLPSQYTQMAELFTIAHDRLGKHHGRWLNRAGILLNGLRQYQQLHDLYHPRIKALEEVLPANSTELAAACNYYGLALNTLGHYSDALTYSQKALTIRQAELPEDDADLARSYNNVGNTFGNLGDHKKALEYKLKALKIFEQVLPPTHPDLATSYNHVGSTYGDLGDHEKALEYLLKALTIREQVLPPTHPDLATSYNNVGSTYGDLGDHKKELEYQLKALTIREQVLPPTHPELASSYNNVGSTYLHLGDHEKALEYQLKALGILEQSLPPDHPNIVIFRSNIAMTYAQMDDFIRANEYMRQALDSAERSMRGHPKLEMYRQAAKIMELCAMFQEAGMPLPFDNPFR